MKKSLFYILLFVLPACSKHTGSEQFLGVEELQVPINQTLKLSEFVEKIEYQALPKEVSAGFFDKVIATDKYFILADYEMSMKIFVLDKNLNLVTTINNYGEGPGEYLWIEGVDYNEEKETVEVLTSKNLIRYSVEGKHIESVKLPFAFGNFSNTHGDNYIIYNNNLTTIAPENSYLYASWNSKTNSLKPLVTHTKNELVSSHIDRKNIFRYKNEIYATHIFLDTLYKFDKNNNLHKYHINLGGQNLPLSYVKFNSENGHESILDDNEFMKNYAFHYPILMVSEDFIVDGFIKDNNINFFIININNGKIISGNKIVNDIDFGINYLNPRFLDSSNILYQFFQYEELKDISSNNLNQNSPLTKFVDSLSSETGFVAVKYKLKQF